MTKVDRKIFQPTQVTEMIIDGTCNKDKGGISMSKFINNAIISYCTPYNEALRKDGNASRCIGKYLFEKGLTDKTVIRLLTLSGIKILNLHLDKSGKTVESVTVDMLEPVLANKSQLASEDGSMTDGLVDVVDTEFRGTFVSMGNPHFVIFVDDISSIDVTKYGKALEYDSLFPERCNIEFAQVLGDGSIRTRVWERGSGITMACGTGACATAVAAAVTGRASTKSDIVMDGGTLHIEWNEADNHVYMTGPAAFAFEGEIALPE